MSDRRRKSEASWNNKEDKILSRWSNADVNDDMIPGNHSGRSSWDSLQGNKNRPKGDDIGRDRHRMLTDPNIDEWGKQYSTRPSDDCYDLSYRSRDRGVRDSGHMGRDRDRPRTPYRSRNISRSRSRSRSRHRDWENARTRSRSPLRDDDRDRDESNEYSNVRNNSRLLSRPCKDFGSRRGGIQVDNNNLTDSWSRRPGGSRDDDYHRDSRDNWNRNVPDDQDHRRQSNQNSRVVPCRYFSAGKCNRDDCRFSHESGSLGNNNSRWHDQQPHDDLNPKSNFCEKKKSWNGPSWDDVDSSCYDNILGHTSDDKKKLSDGPSWDDVRKSESTFDNKNRSWNNSSRDGVSGFFNVSKPSHYSENKSRNNNASGTMSEKTGGKTNKWNGPLWDEVSESGYSDVGKSSKRDMASSVMLLQTDNKIRKWDGPELNIMASEKHDHFLPQRTSVTGEKTKKWNGPLWDEVSESGYSDVGKSSGGDMTSSVMLRQTDNKIRKWDGPELNEMASEKHDHSLPQRTSVAGGKTKKWNGPLWNEVSESGYSDVRKSSGGDMTSSVMPLQMDNKIRKWDGPELNEMAYEKHDQFLPQQTSVTGLQSHTQNVQEHHVMPEALGGRYAKAPSALTPELFVASSNIDNVDIISEAANNQILTSGKDSINDMNSKSLFYSNGTTQNQHMLPFSGPIIQLNRQVEGTFSHMRQTEDKNKEGDKPLKPSETDAPQEINEFNPIPASLPEMSPKGHLPQLYTELNLSNAIDFLKSLPNSAYNENTKPVEKDNSAAATMDVKASLPIMSGLERQDNQVFPPILTDGPTFATKIGENPSMEKSPKTKKQGLIGNSEGSHIRVVEGANQEQELIEPDKVEEGDITNDEKAMRLFKVALVEFVKEILKPKWKEGKMSRDIHKTVVKKVVEKVTSTIQGIQIPRTQAKIGQYLACSKPKIAKLVEAYVERLLK